MKKLRNWNKNNVIPGRVGEKHMTNEGYEIEIIEYINCRTCTIQFEDLGTVKNVPYTSIKNGAIRNRNNKTVHGIGYIGYGEYLGCIDNKATKGYSVWRGMIRRCYSEKNFLKHPTYKDVVVCEEWYNFQNFAKWYYENYIEGFELDKDILCGNCKIYSPKTCCFVPKEVNILYNTFHKPSKFFRKSGLKFTVAYSGYYLGTFETEKEAIHAHKKLKQEVVKGVINKYKDLIDLNVYDKLIEEINKL